MQMPFLLYYVSLTLSFKMRITRIALDLNEIAPPIYTHILNLFPIIGVGFGASYSNSLYLRPLGNTKPKVLDMGPFNIQ